MRWGLCNLTEGVYFYSRSPQQALFGAPLGPCRVPSQHIVKNRILRQLSADELKSIQPWLTLVQLRANTVLHKSGSPLGQIYFPLSGMISLLAVMQSGEQIETGIVGTEGLLGGDAPVNGHLFGQATVQLDGAL
jgi:hypothetical protein